MLYSLEQVGHFGKAMVFPDRTVALHSMLNGGGYSFEHSKDYVWNGLHRGPAEFAIWQYTVSGRGKVVYEGKEYDVPPQSAMVLYIPHDHIYSLPYDSPYWEFIFVNLYGSEAMRLWRELIAITGPVVRFGDDSPTLELASRILTMIHGNSITSGFQASEWGYRFLMTIYNELIVTGGQGAAQQPDYVRKVINFCRDHLSEPINVDDMAEAAGYSRYHFSRVFTKHQKMSPAAFLKNLRLRNAVRLLQTEMITIKEVATRCGFEDDSYFCKCFRAEYGVSPDSFRKGEQEVPR